MIAPYDPLWPEEFRAEADRITRACHELEIRVEHIGSTAIPGLSATPIIDIAAGIPPRTSREPYIQVLKELGYDHRGSPGSPARDLFQRGRPRSHHVHLMSWSSGLWRDHLLFRDALRADPRQMREYEALKRQLAIAYADDRRKYQSEKGLFIQAVLRSAKSARR